MLIDSVTRYTQPDAKNLENYFRDLDLLHSLFTDQIIHKLVIEKTHVPVPEESKQTLIPPVLQQHIPPSKVPIHSVGRGDLLPEIGLPPGEYTVPPGAEGSQMGPQHPIFQQRVTVPPPPPPPSPEVSKEKSEGDIFTPPLQKGKSAEPKPDHLRVPGFEPSPFYR